jgi:NAD(P)-dependent dehydrogenase (short-subunit alcohol dehydrogenase family)
MERALAVGGTGMLRGLCLALASRGFSVEVMARNRARLDKLAEEARTLKGSIQSWAVNYGNDEALREAMKNLTKGTVPVGLAVCWIHSTAPRAPLIVAEELRPPGDSPCRYFHVLGSASASPVRAEEDWKKRFEAMPWIRYRRVYLGFAVENGRSRWLRDEEICRGVMDAVMADRETCTVGTLKPWEARP